MAIERPTQTTSTTPDERSARRVTLAAPAGNYLGAVDEDGRAVFAGVPFAAPPVGRLRFRPPAPLPDTVDVVDATRFRAAPAQGATALTVESDDAGPGDTALASPFAALAGSATSMETSEDCLYLNVWTPDIAASRPVIVWIYGGGFDTGSAAPPITDGAALSRLTDSVVVAVNYRVGALGFGYWRGVGGDEWAQSSNLGLQDQIAGLAWVRRNIAAFGGDPANITLAGESAGAFCIGSLLAIPTARELFDNAILHSGSTRRIFPTDTADQIARDLIARVGARTMDELQTMDVEAILAAQSAVVDGDIGKRNLPGGRSWGVVLDGVILTEQPLDVVRTGEARGIPLLIGANRDETSPFRALLGAAWPPAGEEALIAEIGRAGAADPQTVFAAYVMDAPAGADLGALRSAFLSDAIYRRPAYETATAQRAAGGRAWSYLFSAAPFGPAIGAGHGMDLLYTFDSLAAMGQDTAENLAIQKAFLGAWASFAAHHDPGWPEYDHTAPETSRQFGGDSDLISEPAFTAVRQAWPLG